MRILVVSRSDLARDPRVNRQIRFLARSHEVDAAGSAPSGFERKFYCIPEMRRTKVQSALAALRLLVRRFAVEEEREGVFFKTAIEEMRTGCYDLVVANDANALPIAARARKGAALLLDLHEYAPREFEDSLRWRLTRGPYLSYLIRSRLHEVDAATTVCDGIAREYADHFGLVPRVVRNASAYVPLEPGSVALGGVIRLVHHGAALRSRGLEAMIDTMRKLGSGFELTFMLVENDPGYARELRERARGMGNVSFASPVPLERICHELNRFDIGLYVLKPTNFNNTYALPNKFFEFVQARLMLAIGPSPEMASIVKEHNLGIVAEDFSPEAMAQALQGLSVESIARYKINAHKAATQLSLDREMETFLLAVYEAVESPRLRASRKVR
jgi:hypothetical protein